MALTHCMFFSLSSPSLSMFFPLIFTFLYSSLLPMLPPLLFPFFLWFLFILSIPSHLFPFLSSLFFCLYVLFLSFHSILLNNVSSPLLTSSRCTVRPWQQGELYRRPRRRYGRLHRILGQLPQIVELRCPGRGKHWKRERKKGRGGGGKGEEKSEDMEEKRRGWGLETSEVGRYLVQMFGHRSSSLSLSLSTSSPFMNAKYEKLRVSHVV